MKEYKNIARKFRPKTFEEVLGQEVIVTTLKNAIKHNRLVHAYLFSGSRGTGKTTLARIFAKAINCSELSSLGEPCNCCSSCKDINSGASLDVLEIDGASNRSIEDIRQINETVAYTTASGKYKIYIIDEVHMLTKEAFNALLKTLEEPPPKVKFFFATTEPHKLPSTIISRCQRFNLKRISHEAIVQKLSKVARDLNREVADKALRLIASRAEGGLRDAESLLDQILAFHEGAIGEEEALSALGVVSKSTFFAFDKECHAGNLAAAFTLSQHIFSEGKDLSFFAEGLLEHFRTLNLVKHAGHEAPFLDLTSEERERYAASAAYYTKEQLLSILDMCLEAYMQVRQAPSLRIAIEALLLRIMRTRFKIPIDQLVEQLRELEKKVQSKPAVESPIPKPQVRPQTVENVTEDPTPTPNDLLGLPVPPMQIKTPRSFTIPKPPEAPPLAEPPQTLTSPPIEPQKTLSPSIEQPKTPPSEPPSKPTATLPLLEKKRQAQIDTLLYFAAYELNGKIQKK